LYWRNRSVEFLSNQKEVALILDNYARIIKHQAGLSNLVKEMNNVSRRLAKVVFAKLYATKISITEANRRRITFGPSVADESLPMLRILTERGNEYCGPAEARDDYQLEFFVSNILLNIKLSFTSLS
jgi:hypothetical protein